MTARRLLVAVSFIAFGLGAMAVEGSLQPEPGVGFAIGFACFLSAALVGVRERG